MTGPDGPLRATSSTTGGSGGLLALGEPPGTVAGPRDGRRATSSTSAGQGGADGHWLPAAAGVGRGWLPLGWVRGV